MANEGIAAVVAALVADLPEVRVGRHLHNANFTVGGKVFAFVKGDGLALKLPRARIAEVVAGGHAAPLVMGKRTMREWVLLRHPVPEGFRADAGLLAEARAFVAADIGARAAPRGDVR